MGDNIENLYTLIITIGVTVFMLGLAIYILIRVLNEKKQLDANVSVNVLTSAKNTSIYLIIFNILNGLSLVTILPIIAFVFINQSKSLFNDSEFPLSLKKVKIANVLNLIAAILLLVSLGIQGVRVFMERILVVFY